MFSSSLRPSLMITGLIGLIYVALLVIDQSLVLPLAVVLFCVSLFTLVKAADVFTDVAVTLGEKLGLSKLNTGVLIIAIGTSAPELFSSVGAAMNQQTDLVVGNILGTVVANCLLGIGVAGVASKRALPVHKEVHGSQMSVFVIVSLILIGCLYNGILSRLEALLLLALLGFYLYTLICESRRDQAQNLAEQAQNEDTDESANDSMLPMVGLLLLNLAALFLSGEVVVTTLLDGAESLGISSAKLATSVLAIGTSIPEIATAIALVRKNNADSLFGEILGSNIFDYLGVFGLIGLFTDITLAGPLLTYLLLSAVAVVISTWIVMNDRMITRIEGVILLALFAVFIIQLTELPLA